MMISMVEQGASLDYPRGGMGAIADLFVDVIRESGGQVHLKSTVKNIAVEKGRAVGVCLRDGSFVRFSSPKQLLIVYLLQGKRRYSVYMVGQGGL